MSSPRPTRQSTSRGSLHRREGHRCRYKADFIEVEPERSTTWTSVRSNSSPSPPVSIPFLEHDDANRALMGSNMQRQAVPLLVNEAPFVGTGLEGRVARDSKACIIAEHAGIVASVSSQAHRHHQGRRGARKQLRQATRRRTRRRRLWVYELRKFMRSNAGTCFNQKPVIQKGQHIKVKGQLIADGPCTENGERDCAWPQRVRRVHAVERPTTSRTPSSSPRN